MPTSSFAQNLKLLCSYKPSISAVCRGIGINRQQFNKYLSGQTVPSLRNLRRICDYFGVEEAELSLPSERFQEIIVLDRETAEAPPAPSLALTPALMEMLEESAHKLARYVGYYYFYYLTPSYPGYIKKSIARIWQHEGRYYSKLLERVNAADRVARHSFVSKFVGMVFYLEGRIFIVDHEWVVKKALSQTILYPSFRSRVDILPGLTFGVEGSSARSPFAARVVFEYLGPSIDIRASLRSCGVFHEDGAEVDPMIKTRIRNSLADHPVLLGSDH